MNTKTKSLCSYIFPAVGGLFVTYLYNVVDGIFVGQGVGSAALGAVNIGVSFITFVVAVIDFVLIRKICKRGVPEAISQLTTPVTALCYNLMLASLIGDIGVSTFSVLSFIYSLVNAVLSGVAQGLQPLWGNGYGKRNADEMS